MSPDQLHVVTCVSNPVRYRTRYELYERFAKHMEDSGAVLWTVEMAFGDRPHAVTSADNPHHIQLRSNQEIWHKENMLNIGISRLPPEAKYIAWVDADVIFQRPDWIKETIEQLQHYKFVQMFSHAIDLGPRFEPMSTHTGFMHDWYHNREIKDSKGVVHPGHPGYAWACRRDALDACGGLIDFGVLGAGDRHMADALIGKVERSYPKALHDNYKKLCQQWQSRAETNVQRSVGYVDGTILHYFHGAKSNRGYVSRWKIFIDNNYDPYTDVVKDSQGLWRWSTDKIGLRDDVRRYFRSRQEDCIYTGEYRLLS